MDRRQVSFLHEDREVSPGTHNKLISQWSQVHLPLISITPNCCDSENFVISEKSDENTSQRDRGQPLTFDSEEPFPQRFLMVLYQNTHLTLMPGLAQ